MNLHGLIMNLPCISPGYGATTTKHYKEGHRDARHAAAELALAADEKIELLTEFQREIERCFDIAQRLDAINSTLPGAFTGTPSERIVRQLAAMPQVGWVDA